MSEKEMAGGRKEDWKLAGNLYLRTILAAIMAFFVFISVEMVFTGLFSEDVGYSVGIVELDGEKKYLTYDTTDIEQVYTDLRARGYEVNVESTTTAKGGETTADPSASGTSADATDTTAETTATAETTESAETTAETAASAADGAASSGATEPKIQITIQKLSELSPAASTVSYILSQICMLLIYISLLYSCVWTRGDKDRNLVQFGHAAADPYKGFRVGLYAMIPSAAAYAVLLLSKCGLLLPDFVKYYRYCHLAFFPLYLALVPNSIVLTADLSWLRLLGLLGLVALLPLITGGAYLLGYHQVSLSERLIYKNPQRKHKKR